MVKLFRKNQWFYIPYFTFLLIGGIVLLFFKKTDIHLFINNIHCISADYFFKYYTHAGDGIVVAIVIFLLLFFSYRNTIILAISTLMSTFVLLLFKEILLSDVDRPKMVFIKINQMLYFVPGVNVHLNYSFPSGHTISGFSLFLFFALISKNRTLKFLFFILAFLIGYSRMYLSQHFLIDIYFGSLIGVIFTTLAFLWVSNWKNNKLEFSLLHTLRIIKHDKQAKD